MVGSGASMACAGVVVATHAAAAAASTWAAADLAGANLGA